MATYNTAFKSGNFDGAPGPDATTFAVTGFTPDSGDVGRLIIITSGGARLQHREIIAVSGQNITIAHSWDTNPFIDPTVGKRATDVLPASGDTVAISYLITDLVFSDPQMILNGNNKITFSGAVTVENGAYIFCKDVVIEANGENIESGSGGGFIMGYYGYVAGEDGYSKHACTYVCTGGGTGNPGRVSSASFGMWDFYGGNIYIPVGTPFFRLYTNIEQELDTQARWINVDVYGSLGGRVGGSRSMLVLSNQGSQTPFGIFNTRSPVARVEFTALDCNQAGYVFLNEAPVGRAVFPRLSNIADRLFRVTGNGSGVYECIAKKSEVDQIPLFLVSEGANGSHIFRYGNLVRPTYIDAVGAPVVSNIKTRLYDDTAAFVQEQDVTTGVFTELFVRHTDMVSTSGNQTLASGTLFAPYSLRSVSYGKLFTTSVITAEDTFEPAIVMLDDLSITEASKATVDAYTQLETVERFYDRAVAWLVDNITDEAAFLVTRSSDTIDAGSYDVVIDATASTAFAFNGSTITIRAETFVGNLTTTGVVSVANGGVINGVVSDTNGTTGILEFT